MFRCQKSFSSDINLALSVPWIVNLQQHSRTDQITGHREWTNIRHPDWRASAQEHCIAHHAETYWTNSLALALVPRVKHWLFRKISGLTSSFAPFSKMSLPVDIGYDSYRSTVWTYVVLPPNLDLQLQFVLFGMLAIRPSFSDSAQLKIDRSHQSKENRIRSSSACIAVKATLWTWS